MAFGAQTLHVATRLRRGYPLAFAARHRRAAVKRRAELELNKRKTGAHTLEKAFIKRFGLAHHQAMTDLNARLLKTVQAPARHLRVRVLHCRDNARDARVNQRIAARRRASVVATGFKRDIRGSTARLVARHAQRMHFGMRLAGAQMKAFADDYAIFNNHAAHARIRMRGKTSLARELKGARHVKFVRHRLIL
ncbi:hypothetical protein BN131_3293 [Cronobacter malonaticus 681]|nr:hypothetical protein BN131_3293 [Cronobacter malonaticus 681]